MKNNEYPKGLLGGLIIVVIIALTLLECRAEQWTLEAGATTYTDDGVSIGWYEPDTVVDIIGVASDGKWQTSDDLYIEPMEARKHLLGTFKCTYYTPLPSENGGSTLTACGNRLNDVCDYGIAVDTRVIPLGTEVYIEGYGWRKALDTGGAIKGNHIDILTWDVPSWGVCNRKVWVLK